MSPLRIINWENKGWSKNRAQPIACRNGYRMRIHVNRRDCDRRKKKKKEGGGNHEYLDLSEERSQWRRSSLDLPSIAIERANRLFPLCAMSTCDLHLLHFSSQRIFETKEDLFEILLFKGFLVLNGYRYSREFTHLLFVWSKEDLFERILLDFSFSFIGIIFRMQYCNIPCVCVL